MTQKQKQTVDIIVNSQYSKLPSREKHVIGNSIALYQ